MSQVLEKLPVGLRQRTGRHPDMIQDDWRHRGRREVRVAEESRSVDSFDPDVECHKLVF